MLRDICWATTLIMCALWAYIHHKRTRARLLFTYRDPSAVTVIVSDAQGEATTVYLHADEVAALQSEGPLDPVILEASIHEAGQGTALVLDWYHPPWTRDAAGRFSFRAREVRAAVAIACGGVPVRLTRLVHRIGADELLDLPTQYRGVVAFMLFLQAKAALLHRVSVHVADELYPVDPAMLRSSIAAMHGRLNPVDLFRSATHLNDGILMLLSASHTMYEYHLSAKSPVSPRGLFEGCDEDTVIRIRACAKLVSELVTAHMAKGRFQHHLLDAARCDVNSVSYLHGWRPRPLIASGTTAPNVSLGCDAAEAYDSAASTTSLDAILASGITGLNLRTRLATLQAAYPGRRGPCYQSALVYMSRRVQDARMWGLFPVPPTREYGGDDRPYEDNRAGMISVAGSRLYPCASCRATTVYFVKRQLTCVAQMIRDMFEDGAANYFGIDLYSLRAAVLRQTGVDEALFPQDLEHVFDDVPGPFSHPNLSTHLSVDLPWNEPGGGWGSGGGWGGGGGGGGGWGGDVQDEPW